MALRASSILSRALPFLSAALLSCGDDEPSSNTGPERFVFSDDGRAMLWVPEGAAPSDAAITVARGADIAGELGYELEPGGLEFARPAALFVQLGATEDGGRWLPLADVESADGSVEELPSFVWGADVMGGLEDTWVVVPVPHFSKVRVKLPELAGGAVQAGAAIVQVPFHPSRLVGATWDTKVAVAPPGEALGSIEVFASATGAVGLRSKVEDRRILVGGPASPYVVDLPLECRAAGSGKVSVRFVVQVEGRPGADGWVERRAECVEPDEPVLSPPEPAAHVGEALVDSIDGEAEATKAAMSAIFGDPAQLEIAALAFGGALRPEPAPLLELNVPCTECDVDVVYAATASFGTSIDSAEVPYESVVHTGDLYWDVSSEDPFVEVRQGVDAFSSSIDDLVSIAPTPESPIEVPFEFRCKQPGDGFIRAYVSYRRQVASFYTDRLAARALPIRCVAPTEPPCSATDPTMTDVRGVAQLLDFALTCLPVEVTSILHSAVAIGSKLVANDHTTLRRYGTALLGASNRSAGANGPLGANTPAELDPAAFDPADFPCGTGPNGYTLCVDPGLPAPQGPFTVLHTALGGDVPLADAVNHYQYGFVFDADGVAGNNYQPQPQYANDFFKDTDLWYAAEYTPADGWRLRVTDASGGGFVSIPSDARLIIQGNAMVLLVPTSELAVAMPSFRFSAFRHTGDYGLEPPNDWDGSVWPAVADGLAPFSN